MEPTSGICLRLGVLAQTKYSYHRRLAKSTGLLMRNQSPRSCNNFSAAAIAFTFCIASASMAGVEVGFFDDHNSWRQFQSEYKFGISELAETFDSFSVGSHPCPVGRFIAPISWNALTSSGQLEFKPTTAGASGLRACALQTGESIEIEFSPPARGIGVDVVMSTENGYDIHRLQVTLANGNEHSLLFSGAFMASHSLGSPVTKIQVSNLLDAVPVCIDSVYFAIAVPGSDLDSDGIANSSDNCPAIANPTQANCNNDGIGDVCEIAAGATDYNQDTIPDTCQCLADLVINHEVNGADLGALLAFWGPVNPALTSADINRDGNVDGADLGYLLYAWGLCSN